MASTSSQQHNQLEFAYPTTSTRLDVFINHCGTDVSHTLATIIRNTLHGIGLRVFLDEAALEIGDVISTQIQHEIHSASLHIAIFYPNYAHSSWCLQELSLMLTSGTKIIPVFFHVDPSDLRWVDQGKGIYADAFNHHEKQGRYTSQKLQEWKMALQTVSFHSGCVINNNHDEGRALKYIVNMVLKAMEKLPIRVAEYPARLDDVAHDFEGMKALNPFHAKQLFCWHAFLQSHPLNGFEDLVEKFLNACSGSPLALKVFGGQVYGKSKDYCESQLLKISRIMPENIKQRMKVSFDALDKDEQEVSSWM
ncbi:hypothetical protein KI387_042656 [Taxus chinensis]|uniref:TIR domain-containing protein n=1 Tax=Taxus chinensis TaxID=29808 RepID=A0AA38C2A6_TAXCH|nr:hypothetical protein KI387_042656 [Taxus chinensis]